MSNEIIYIIGDGDDVRKHIDRLILSKKFDELRSLSLKIDSEIKELCKIIRNELNADIIYSNGDGFLAIVNEAKNLDEISKKWQNSFYDSCGISLSIGFGPTIESALIELKWAKSK